MRIMRSRPVSYIGKGDWVAYRPDIAVEEGALVSETRLHRVMTVTETDAGITIELETENGDRGVLTDLPEVASLYRGEYS